MERYVNEGSPSGFSKNTTSWQTSPQHGDGSFLLPNCVFNKNVVVKDYGVNLLKQDLDRHSLFIHPDMLQYKCMSNNIKVINVDDSLMVYPLASGRTVLISSGDFAIKLSYNKLLGRTNRQLTYKHLISSIEINNTLQNLLVNEKGLDRVAYLPEFYGKVAYFPDKLTEWGMVVRSQLPYPLRNEDFCLIPCFSLFSKDSRSLNDEPLLIQIYKHQNKNIDDFLFFDLIKPIFDSFFIILLKTGLLIEAHAQNMLFTMDKNFKISRVVYRDLESVDKDVTLMKILGIENNYTMTNYKFIKDTDYNYSKKHSFMFDFKMGVYLIDRLIDCARSYFYFKEQILKEKIWELNQSYISQLPPNYFPEKWYDYPNHVFKENRRRKYTSHLHPKYRMTKEKMMNRTLFNQTIEKINTIKDNEGKNLSIKSIYISFDGDMHSHHFVDADQKYNLRSACKVLIALAIGIAIDEKMIVNGEPLSLETYIWPTLQGIEKIVNLNNLEKLKKMKLKHLLTHTMGYNVKLLKSKDIKGMNYYDLLDYTLNYDLVYEPGEYFLYSNAGPYVISAFFQENFRQNISDFINDKIFKKINILNYEWINYGKYCAASTGLYLRNYDLHKVGLLLLNQGVYNDQQIVSANWIKQQTSPQVVTPEMYDEKRVFPKYAYGYLMWVCKDGSCYVDGTDGQYLIVIPRKKIVITTIADQKDMKPITRCFDHLL